MKHDTTQQIITRFAHFAALGLALLATTTWATQDTATPSGGTLFIQGRVQDSLSGSAVAQAEVVLEGTSFKTLTDRSGRFAFSGLAAQAYSVKVARSGYSEVVIPSVVAQSEPVKPISIDMNRIVTRLEDVTVTPGAYSFMEGNLGSRQTMSRDEIESAPQLGEDIFRAVNRLPGLSSGDYSAHFSIRGGRHDETLILLDGLELFEPYHLKDFNEGAISIIDTQTIDGVELLTGGFGAQYGNKRSGVMSITSRTPESDRARYSAGVSFLNARAMGRGPLWEGRGSWLVSARSGYMDLVFGLINQNQLPSPRYYDIFGKLQRTFGTSHVWTMDALYARDRYTFDAPTTTGFEDSLRTRENARNRYGNAYVWTTLNSSLGTKATLRTLLSASLVTRSRDGSERYVDFGNKPIYSLTNARDYGILGAKQDLRFKASDRVILETGFDARRVSNTDTFQKIVNQDPNDPFVDKFGIYPLTQNTRFQKTGSRLGLYATSRVRVLSPLTIEVGGRYDRTSYTGDRDVSPRASAALDLGHGRTLRAGWGKYRQVQGIDEVAALNDGGRFFRSELSEQLTVGFEQQLAQGTLFRVEAYRKDGSRLRPVYRNWKNTPDTFPEANEDRILLFPRTSATKGLEVSLSRDWGERFTVNANYSYARAEERIDKVTNINATFPIFFDTTQPGPQDQRHAGHLDIAWKLKTWAVHGTLAYHSGWPVTLERLESFLDADGDPTSGLRPIKLYGSRLPAYFRFDARATKKWKQWQAFLELVNVTNHANVFGYDYFRTREAGGRIGFKRNDEKWFTILPSIGVSWGTRF